MIQNNSLSSSELAWIQRVEKMAADVAAREGCILYDLEFVPGRILRVYIDREIPRQAPASEDMAPVDDGAEAQAPTAESSTSESDDGSISETLPVTGAGIDDCSNVSKGLNLLLDVDDVVPGGKYHLEVSTPGIDRQLKKPWHFEKVVGKKIWVKTRSPFETFGVSQPSIMKAKQVEAVLTAVQDGKLLLEAPQAKIEIPMAEIEKSKVVFEMKKKNEKKPRGSNGR